MTPKTKTHSTTRTKDNSTSVWPDSSVWIVIGLPLALSWWERFIVKRHTYGEDVLAPGKELRYWRGHESVGVGYGNGYDVTRPASLIRAPAAVGGTSYTDVVAVRAIKEAIGSCLKGLDN